MASNLNACTVEMWLRPSQTETSATLLAFYGPKGKAGLSLCQSLSDLLTGLRNCPIEAGEVLRGRRLSRRDALVSGSCLRAGRDQIYGDGSLIRQLAAAEPLQGACSGRFVLGDSPHENDTWPGELSGLAIYQSALTPDEVKSDYVSWSGKSGHPRGDGAAALYLFNEKNGSLIPDCGLAHADLFIADRYQIAQQTLLESPWSAFEPTSDYVKDVSGQRRRVHPVWRHP